MQQIFIDLLTYSVDNLQYLLKYVYLYIQLNFVQQIPNLSIKHPPFISKMPILPKSRSKFSISVFSVWSIKSYISYHSLIYILMLFLLMGTCTCYDTKIPVQKIQDERTITTIYNINYLQQGNNSQWLSNNLQDNIVRVRLGKNNAKILNKMSPINGNGNSFEVTNQNIFDWSVHQLQDTNNNGGASSANSICDVVKVIQYNGNYDKYILNYNIKNHNLNTNKDKDEDQKFISTVHRTQSTTYLSKFTNPLNKGKITNDIKQTQQKITIYSLTNTYNIHKIIINTKQVMIAKQQSLLLNQQSSQQSNNKYINKNKATQQKIYKIKGITHQKCKNAEIQLFMINTHVVISCVKQSQLGIFPIEFIDKQWQILHDKGIILNTDGNIQIKQNQHVNDHDIYIMTQSHIYRVSNPFTDKPDNIKLTYKQLNLKQFSGMPSFITFTITNSQLAPYLLLIQQKNGILFYNVHTNTIQFKDNFQNKFNMADVQLLTYTNKLNIKQNNSIYGVLQIVVLVDDRKQFIVQIFHQWNKDNHKLHINKIYHSYNANTNQAYIQQQQQQNSLNNIHYIQQILQPTTNTGIHNNIGILKLQNRLIFFHYGIPRTISPSFSSSSQFIRQQTYKKIVNIRDAHAQKSIKQNKIYNQQQVRSHIDAAQRTGRMLVDMNNLVKYIVTLDKYIHVIQIDPRNMYHHDYVCNLNSIGVITQQHKLLNDVKIYLQTLCDVDQKKNMNNDDKQNQNNTKYLAYCQVKQTIKFNVNFNSLQNQRDLKRHIGFIVFVVIVSILLAIIVAKLLHNIRKQAEKLNILRKQRKRVMENSVIERTEVSQANAFISQLSIKGGKQFVIS